MSHVIVTVEFENSQTDLALPLNVPNQALANAVAQALEVDKDVTSNYTLTIKTDQGSLSLSPNSTLGNAGVLDGFYLHLRRVEEKNPPAKKGKFQAYLHSEKGDMFPLTSDHSSIGRKDIKRGMIVDVDISHLDSSKIVSRRHASVERNKDKWLLVDQKSVNGTWLNGHQLKSHEPYPLQDGDEIIFGKNGVVLKFFTGG